MNWKPIDTAPQDGRPIWVRGYDWGNEDRPRHYTWAYWNGTEWRESGSEGSTLQYLTDWLDLIESAG